MRTLATALALTALALPAAAEGDAEAGEKVFRKCQACHMVGEDAKNRVGPHLNGIVGGEIATVEDYKYSDALVEKQGETWTDENLHAYLEDPRGWAEGTKMSYPGLKDEQERADVIAYLATFE